MAVGGRTLTIYLAADTRRATRALDTFNTRLTRFAAVGAAAAGVAVGILAVKVADFAAASVEAAQAAKETEAGLRNVTKQMGLTKGEYKGATDRVLDYASALSTAIGVEDETIIAVQTKLATFRDLATSINDAGGAFDRATQAAFDLASAGFGTAETNAIQLGKALNDPIKGLTSLARAGVTFTDAEKARIAALVESNELGKAQALILEAIETQVGGTAEATTSASERMGVAWGELQEDVGRALLPAFESIATTITESVIPALSDLWERVAPGVRRALKRLSDWFATDGAEAIKDFATWLTTDGKRAWDSMTAYVGSVKDALDDIIGSIDKVKAAFTTGGGSGDDGGLAGIVNNVANAFRWLDENDALFFGWRRIPGIVDAVAEAIVNLWEGAKSFWEWSQDADESIEQWWRDIGTAIVDGFKAGVAPLTGAIDWVQKQMLGLPAGVFEILGINSPSKVFIKIGGSIVEGFTIGVRGLGDETDKVADRFGNMADRVEASINRMIERAQQRLADAKAAFADFAAGVQADLMGALQLTTTEEGAFDPAAWAQEVQTSTDWATALRDIAANPAFGDGLVTMLAGMAPEAGLAFVNSLTPAMVEQLNADLASVELISEEASLAMAERFKRQGITDAEAHMEGLGERIQAKLDWLYEQGRQMGLAVSRGYRDATASLPGNGGAGNPRAAAATRSTGQTVNVTVQAGIGNPIEIARTIESVLASKSVRLGVA